MTDLGPTAQTWSDPVANAVVRNLSFEILFKFRTFWPGSNQAHVAVDHIEELRQFIDP